MGCRLAPLPITGDDYDYWTAAEGTADMLYTTPEEDMLTLVLQGVDGPRLFSNDMTQFGLYSAKMKVTEVNGCISAFYVGGSRRAQ